MTPNQSRRAGTIALAAAALVGAACGASPRAEREVMARNAAILRAGGPGSPAAGYGAFDSGTGLAAGASAGTAAAATDELPASSGASGASGAASGPTARAGGGIGSPGPARSAGSGATRAAAPGTAAGTATAGSGPSAAASSSGGPAGAAVPTPGTGAVPPAGGNGGATDTGVTATSIKVGATFFNGGYLDKYSQMTEQAASAYFKYVNDRGGIFGRRIDYIPCDTAGTADGTQGCLRKLANDDKVFTMGPSLDFNLDTVPTFLADKGLPWVGSSGLYPEEYKSPFMFPSQMPGDDAGAQIATFAGKTLGVATVGVSYLTDGPGPSCTEAVKKVGERLGFKVVATAGNPQTQGDMTQQVLTVRQANPDAVLFCNDPINTVKFVQAAGRVGYKPPKGWVGAFVAADDVPQAMGAAGVGFYGSAPFDFYGGTSPGVVQYRRITESYFPSIAHHAYTQSAYTGARALVEAITRAGPQLTRKGLLGALAGMTDFDSSMGLHFDFSKKGNRSSGLILQADENLRWKPVADRFSAAAR